MAGSRVTTPTPSEKPSRSRPVRDAAKRSSSSTRRSHVAVDRQLPKSVVAELKRSVETVEAITSGLVAELDRRLNIESRHGISKRRLGNYLRRLHADRTAASPRDSKQAPDETQAPFSERMTAHRRRQESVGSILDETFGRLAKCHPDLWEHRAYLMLVGLVYERLATDEKALSTEELSSLSKVLAENRRAEAQSQKKKPTEESAKDEAPPSSALPENFADIVRQVYGTNFQMSDGDGSKSEP